LPATIVALGGAEGSPHRRHAVRSEQAGDSGKRWSFPEAGHRNRDRAEIEGRPGKSSASRLAKLAAEDPSFRVSTDQESGQTILKGMGELHLDIKVDILKRTYKVDANIGAPQVAFP